MSWNFDPLSSLVTPHSSSDDEFTLLAILVVFKTCPGASSQYLNNAANRSSSSSVPDSRSVGSNRVQRS